jgi:hypothetical protein
MVVTTDILYTFADISAGDQHFVTTHGMLFDDLEFLGRELTRFVKTSWGHGALPRSCSIPGHACLVALRVGQAQLAPQGNHQRAHR